MNIRKLFVIISIGSVLGACGVSPNKTQTSIPDVIESIAIDDRTQEQKLLANIEQLHAINQDVGKRNMMLLKLADNYRGIGNCSASNIIIKHLEGSLNSTEQIAVANLLKAECALESLSGISDLSNKQPLLELIEKWLISANAGAIRSANLSIDESPETAVDLLTRLQIASSSLLAENKQFSSALHALLTVNINEKFADQPNLSSHFYNKAWEWFSIIDETERGQLANTYPILGDYKILLDTIEDSSINDNVRQETINQWLLSNTNQTLTNYLPKQIQSYLAITHRQNQNIAVLLPLSGRLSAQGEAIKQGILSAYYGKLAAAKNNNQQVQVGIEFIDTGSQSDMPALINAESFASFDTIIGPLLRSHIEQLASFNLTDKRKLILNQAPIVEDDSGNLSASFSLAPEQEAQQVVALMRSRNILNPILIDDGSSTTQRMNSAFIEAWQATELSQNKETTALQQIRYSDNNSMRVGITSALDVLQSQKRIKQLSNISQDEVYSVTRNRRDIDAFVIFAKPNDLELINPIIESSISLFTSEQIPVFATSYGYDHKQSKNSQRDLRNLVFVDMPWLLPEQRGEELSQMVDVLFNEPPSAFLRLFAFGYDALALVDNLAQLSTFEHLYVKGLSGNLYVNESRGLTREMSWLSISK